MPARGPNFWSPNRIYSLQGRAGVLSPCCACLASVIAEPRWRAQEHGIVHLLLLALAVGAAAALVPCPHDDDRGETGNDQYAATIAYVTVEPESPLPPLPLLLASTSVEARPLTGASPEGAELLGELLCGAGGPGNKDKEVGDGTDAAWRAGSTAPTSAEPSMPLTVPCSAPCSATCWRAGSMVQTSAGPSVPPTAPGSAPCSATWWAACRAALSARRSATSGMASALVVSGSSVPLTAPCSRARCRHRSRRRRRRGPGRRHYRARRRARRPQASPRPRRRRASPPSGRPR
jgi:hypothetical protein